VVVVCVEWLCVVCVEWCVLSSGGVWCMLDGVFQRKSVEFASDMGVSLSVCL
jgi:hypothetical protein